MQKPSLNQTKLQPSDDIKNEFKKHTYTNDTKSKKTKTWLRCLLHHLARKWMRPILQLPKHTLGRPWPQWLSMWFWRYVQMFGFTYLLTYYHFISCSSQAL